MKFLKKIILLLRGLLIIPKIIWNFFGVLWRETLGFLKLFKKWFKLSNIFHLDNVFAIASLMLFFLLISKITFEIINPIGEAFEDVEMTDVVFSNSTIEKNKDLRIGEADQKQILDTNIIIVNTGNLQRFEIAEVLNVINSFEPKVVAIDLFFNEPREPAFLDMMLEDAFANTKNLIFVSRLDDLNRMDAGQNEYTRTYNTCGSEYNSIHKFKQYGSSGFANMVTDAQSSHMNICRNFMSRVIHRETKDTLYSWPVEIVRKYKPEALQPLFERNNREEVIDYVGNIWVATPLLSYQVNKTKEWEKPHFKALNHTTIMDLIDTNKTITLDSAIFKDKIVMLGYLGRKVDVEESGEDLFYTPLNEKYVGKAHKDMYGIVVHANIISTILRASYIDETNPIIMHVVGFITLYLVFAFYRPIYQDHKIWYDGITKVIGIVLTILILFIIGIVFVNFNYKITFGAIWFGAILLAGDWLEIYYGIIRNIGSKIKSKIKHN